MRLKKQVDAKLLELKNRAIEANREKQKFDMSARYISPRLHSKMLALEWVLGYVSDL